MICSAASQRVNPIAHNFTPRSWIIEIRQETRVKLIVNSHISVIRAVRNVEKRRNIPRVLLNLPSKLWSGYFPRAALMRLALPVYPQLPESKKLLGCACKLLGLTRPKKPCLRW